MRHPGEQAAVREMTRVLRPGGPLLADHVAGAAWPVRAAQRAIAAVTVPVQGEHFTRRPVGQVRAEGLQIIGASGSRWDSSNGSPPASRFLYRRAWRAEYWDPSPVAASPARERP